MATQSITASELKYRVENRGTDSHFFSRRSMAFFGDTMRNYGVRVVTVRTNYDSEGNYVNAEGIERECFELYRRNAVKHGLKDSCYFDAETYRQVHGTIV